jgi:hypothetical protein
VEALLVLSLGAVSSISPHKHDIGSVLFFLDSKMTARQMAQSKDRYNMEAGMSSFSSAFI